VGTSVTLGSVRRTDHPPRVVAHRGFAGRYPENTVAAFVAAAPDCDAVELDVHPAADGDPVVFHDDRLDDLTDASGLVRETATSAVVAAEVLGSGETVPRLSEAVAALDADTALNVELKSAGETPRRADEALDRREREAARERWQSFVDRVSGALADAPQEVLYSSFCVGALAALAERGDEALAPLTATGGEWAFDAAARYDAVAIHPAADIVLADAGLVDRAHDDGLAVNAWTVRTWHEAVRASEAGVDACIADYPGLVGRVR
jgi:glycerophosphoryl diester phosphodiesterase